MLSDDHVKKIYKVGLEHVMEQYVSCGDEITVELLVVKTDTAVFLLIFDLWIIFGMGEEKGKYRF